MYMNGKNHRGIKLIVQYLIFVLTVLFADFVWADSTVKTKIANPVEEEGVVKLVATLQDSPAFTDVVWKLYRLELPHFPIMVIPRHTAIVNLKPGNYRAVVRLKSVRRSRSFNLRSRGVKEVIIPMD